MSRGGRRERGFALLMVLWTLMLLAFLATIYGSNARTEVLLARNLVTNARAEALADAGIYRAAAGLARSPREGGFRGNGQVYVWRPDGLDPGVVSEPLDEVRFTVRDEGGKVDINQAPAPLLRELFIAIGVKPESAIALADAIIDFRDENQEKQPHGAEARDYKQAGLPWGPKNKQFDVVDELTYVLGMTPEIYRRVAPLVTVWGLGEAPHPYTAPPEVQRAMLAVLNGGRKGTDDKRHPGSSTSSADTGDSAFGSGSRRSFGSGSSSSGSAFGSSRSSFGSSSSSFGSGGSGSGSSSLGSGSLFDRGGSSSLGSSSGSGSLFGSGSSTGSSSLFGGSRSLFGNSSLSGDGQGAFGADEDEQTDPDQLERSGSTTFSVHAEARTADGTVFARDATVDMTGSESSAVSFRTWRQGERILFPVAPSASPAAAVPPPDRNG